MQTMLMEDFIVTFLCGLAIGFALGMLVYAIVERKRKHDDQKK